MGDTNISGNNNTQIEDRGKAYMGDGVQGIGKFLEGVAAAYLKTKNVTDYEENESDTVVTNSHSDGTENKSLRTDDDTYRRTNIDDYKTYESTLDKDTDIIEHIDTATNTEEEVVRDQQHLNDEQKGILHDWLVKARDKFLGEEFSKRNAKYDVKRGIESIFHDYKEKYLPQIYSAQHAHGIYNDTASQMLADNAYAEAVVKGGKLEIDTIKEYQNLINGFSGQVASGLQIAVSSMLRENLETQRVEDVNKDTGQNKLELGRTYDTTSSQKDSRDKTIRDIISREHNDNTQKQLSTTDTTINKITHEDNRMEQSPDLTEFAKDAAVMALFAGILKPYINRCYVEQHENCSDNSPTGTGEVATIGA